MNNKGYGFYRWERRKTIFPQFNFFTQRFRKFAATTILSAILTTSLLSCAPATPIVETIPPIAAASPTAAPTSTTVPPTETPLTAPTPTVFVPKATIKIVVHAPLTGGGARVGNDISFAAALAVQQLAGPLADLGYRIKLVPYDEQDNMEVALANAREIVADNEVLCGVEHHDSDVMIQVSEMYHLKQLAFVSPSNTVTSLTDRVYPEVNRIIGREDGQGIVGAQFALAQGFKRVYALHSNSNRSARNADLFVREAQRLGVSVVGTWDTDLKENFVYVLRHVLAADPDLVYFATKADQIGPFIREARAAGYVGAFLSSNEANRAIVVELAGPGLVEGGGTYLTDMVARVNNYSEATQFASDFEFTYGTRPRDFAAQAYDATGICMKAIEEASKAKGGELPTRAEVARAIRALVDYQGITGTYSFNRKGDITPASYFVFKVISPDPVNWEQNSVVATYEIDPPR